MGDTLNMVLIAIYKPRVCHSGTETWDEEEWWAEGVAAGEHHVEFVFLC